MKVRESIMVSPAGLRSLFEILLSPADFSSFALLISFLTSTLEVSLNLKTLDPGVLHNLKDQKIIEKIKKIPCLRWGDDTM